MPNPLYSYENRMKKYFEELEQAKTESMATEMESVDTTGLDFTSSLLDENPGHLQAPVNPGDQANHTKCCVDGCENELQESTFLYPGLSVFYRQDQTHYGVWSRFLFANPTCDMCIADKEIGKQIIAALIEVFKQEVKTCKKVLKKKLFYSKDVESFYERSNNEVAAALEKIKKEDDNGAQGKAS